MRRTAFALALLTLPLLAAAPAATDPAVTITRKPPTTRTRTFDPKAPPSDMPKLTGNEAAVTRSAFACASGAKYAILDSHPTSDGRVAVTIRVDAVSMELSLENTIFLPKGAAKKLIAHEQAHAAIAESVYAHAEEVARKLVADIPGKTATATGSDEHAAGTAAFHKLVDPPADQYMKTVPGRSGAVNDAFDQLTKHGTNTLSEADAKVGHPPWTGIAPSPLRAAPDMAVPLEMHVDDIAAVVQAFADAAKRSIAAGFDICEIHGAHGYLIHQFLSPVSNRRTDQYGGDRTGRMRFALEIVEAVRRVWPDDKPLFFRLSAVDGKGGLWNQDDTVALSH